MAAPLFSRELLQPASISKDIDCADTLIGFPDPPRSTNSRGGHFFEEGYAHALGRDAGA
jgi:hypothetical protein